MIKDDMDWLFTNKCKYCGCELGYKPNSERIICKKCGKVTYKNKKSQFENTLKRKILEEKKNEIKRRNKENN